MPMNWSIWKLGLRCREQNESSTTIHVLSVTSEYPQNGGSVCCCYYYRIDARLQKCVVHCVVRVTGCVLSNSCHAEQKYPQDGGHRKKADGGFIDLFILFFFIDLMYTGFCNFIRFRKKVHSWTDRLVDRWTENCRVDQLHLWYKSPIFPSQKVSVTRRTQFSDDCLGYQNYAIICWLLYPIAVFLAVHGNTLNHSLGESLGLLKRYFLWITVPVCSIILHVCRFRLLGTALL